MSDLVKVTSVVKINMAAIDAIDAAARRALEQTAEALHGDIYNSGVIPRMDGKLQGEGFFVDYSGVPEGIARLIHNTAYARRLYYHPEYHFHRDVWTDSKGRSHHGNPNSKGKWFEDWQPGGSKSEFAVNAFAEYMRMEMGS